MNPRHRARRTLSGKMRRRHPFLDVRGPVGIAHRGGSGMAPENTIEAFRGAYAMGFRVMETDVHLTADGDVVAFHDDALDRTTDRAGRIGGLRTADVVAADAGWSFTDADGGYPFRGRGIRIPQLRDLLDAFDDVRWIIDVKTDAVVEPALDVITAAAALDRVCIGSFSGARLDRVRALLGERVCTSMGPREVARLRLGGGFGGSVRPAADCVQIPLTYRGIRLPTAALIARAHRLDLPVHVWTVDDVATMNRLLDVGADGIMSDRIDRLRAVMRRHGWALDGNGRDVTPAGVAHGAG